MNWGIWLRRNSRVVRAQPLAVQVLSASAAVLLVASGLALIARGGDEGAKNSVAAKVKSGQPGDAGIPSTDTTILGLDGKPITVTTIAGAASSGGPTANGPTAGGPGATGTGGAPSTPRVLTASDRGVTANSVKVVFPWFDFTQSGRITGTVSEAENAENAIKAYVNYFNATGGIGGRKIDPLIVEYNPINDPDMRAKCIKWADDDKVFAVVDSEAWHSGHQLCIAQEKQTPLVTSYATINEWTKRGAPYLWWTGPSAEDIVANWILWANERKLLDGKIGVAIADREEDKAVKKLLEDGFRRVGKTAKFEVVPYDNSGASSAAAMPGAVQRMKGKVDNLFMLLPFTQFAGWLTTAEAQDFYPRLLVSDLNQTMVIAEYLLAQQHPRSVNNAIGPTYARLGQFGPPWRYSEAEKKCNEIWKKAYPSAPDMWQAGLAARWCQNISVFVEAARRATEANNGTLTRKNWADAMATIRDFPAAMTPTLSYAPGDYAGATQMKVAIISTDMPRCKREMNDEASGACLIETEPYRPLRSY
jgi:ABC-type branched-subunit amino acid transport system substrate-binding protein